MIRQIAFVAILALLCGCVSESIGQHGVLQGKVNLIFPCKSGDCKVAPDQLAKEYSMRKIVVEPKDMSKTTIRLNISSDGTYQGVLEPGEYMVDIDYGGRGKSFDVPTKVSIEGNKTKTLYIDVDLGLRHED
jgi:hypothetical protein